MRASPLALAAALLASFGAARPVVGQQIVFSAALTNAQESTPALPGGVVPTLTTGAPRPASFGFATFVLNDAHTALSFTATVNNIDFTGSQTADVNDNLVAAHIHASPTLTLPGTAPVVWGFFGTPLNDNNPNDVVFAPFVSGVGGTVSGKWDLAEGNNTTLAAQLPNILAGRSYINFHTKQFGGGEIRGAIVAVTATPEPSALLLVGTGLMVTLGVARPRRS
jgi:hypothetical protein